jgi:hypothetical protein
MSLVPLLGTAFQTRSVRVVSEEQFDAGADRIDIVIDEVGVHTMLKWCRERS